MSEENLEEESRIDKPLSSQRACKDLRESILRVRTQDDLVKPPRGLIGEAKRGEPRLRVVQKELHQEVSLA